MQIVENREKPEQLREALIVRLANKNSITMYGRQVNDLISPKELPGRKKYDIHPYRKAGSGVSTLVTYVDNATQIRYILLGRKYSNPTDKSKGPAKEFIIFGGYMNPHALDGNIADVETISSEEKDLAEEAILLKKDGYNILGKTLAKENHLINNSNFDIDLEANAKRELAEEAGLIWDETKPITLLGVQSKYAYTNDKRLHTIMVDYLFDFGLLDHAPMAIAGSDIAEITWVPLANISKDKSIPPQEYGSSLSRYSVIINGEKCQIADRFGAAIEEYARLINIAL